MKVLNCDKEKAFKILTKAYAISGKLKSPYSRR